MTKPVTNIYKLSDTISVQYTSPTSMLLISPDLMNFKCMDPSRWKSFLVKCFLTRAFRVSSSFELFSTEVTRIKTILSNNGYPSDMVKQLIDEFISNKQINLSSFNTTRTEKSSRSSTDNQVYLTIPYLGKTSLKFQHRMKRNLQQHGLEVLPAYLT